MKKTIQLPYYGIVVEVNTQTKSGSIQPGELREEVSDQDSPEEKAQKEGFNAAFEGILSMVLAHACAGIDVAHHDYGYGIETAVEAILNDAPWEGEIPPEEDQKSRALDLIHSMLDGQEWNADTCFEVAEVLRNAGYVIHDVECDDDDEYEDEYEDA